MECVREKARKNKWVNLKLKNNNRRYERKTKSKNMKSNKQLRKRCKSGSWSKNK